MKIEIDGNSGFCFGVRNAVEIAEKSLLKGEKVYSLGSIVHNDMEVKRLLSIGLISITHDEFRKLRNCKVLIRAHGEPPETYQTAKENNITIIEATCPIVRKLQSRIRDAVKKSHKCEGQIVIFGKPGHAEVIGLMGQTGGEGIIVSGPGDLSKIDISRPVCLFSQTTMSVKAYDEIAGLIREKMRSSGIREPEKSLIVHKTICGQVSNREPDLQKFAREHEVIVFVSGRESSNGKMLYNVCKNVNPQTYFVSAPGEVDKNWFTGINTVGVCGATSTPKWLIENIRDKISELPGPG
ncbi:MAG TPA: 4-hydroxy-3-methylbut-2-enyl diphosphate reductase [Bacteroidales bacterium]|nr:4-hydroxy-3-methylbut-2-enyl diphosphate reductase [Bacteroidales bacterium]HPF03270.1 4-hydroxy-3-methylbut-2-enyl diphosphate reductase [Bacteroidales bacterium]HPJ58749.1 4-hydroxy-3-methylbut-2-enyl diphosphate reductase [Bacteroidales bacterium]HPR11899.1 4-hydroxy-3-methylbut-2-enyl diphosphate reductase [Bacteroidales bacterium]HRW85402.1 4-hydroxy-3-methylbut-2-enyl diphosphate reductase [Bacteroidales bacterium]